MAYMLSDPYVASSMVYCSPVRLTGEQCCKAEALVGQIEHEYQQHAYPTVHAFLR